MLVTAPKRNGKATFDLRDYNGFGQLVQIYRDGQRINITYRPDGFRHSNEVSYPFKPALNRKITHFWDGQNIVLEANTSGEIKAVYLRGIQLICQQIGEEKFYYLHNAHGDVVQRIAENGTSAPQYKYDAFGNEKEPSDTDPNPFRYCGEYFDFETGEYYLRARSYNPSTGRFASEDPAEDGENWYSYCEGNPVTRWDPTGMAWWHWVVGAVVAVVIVAVVVVTAGAALAALGATAAVVNGAMIGAAVGGTIGAVVGGVKAHESGATGWDIVGSIAKGAYCGAVLGGMAGAAAGFAMPYVSSFLSSSITIGAGTTMGSGGVAVASAGVTVTGAQVAGAAGVVAGALGLMAFAKTSKQSRKERATDAPSWAKHETYDPSLTAEENATRALDDKYGAGNWGKRGQREYSEIVKWLKRAKGYK